MTHYLSPKLTPAWINDKSRFGVFARDVIKPGELLSVLGGKIVDRDRFQGSPADQRDYALQVEDDLYLAPINDPEPANYFNHSCNPNAGLRGQIALVSMREILPGEEVCYDFAMNHASQSDTFQCTCRAAECRQVITGDDWRLSELWQRYQGFYSPFIQHKIDCLMAGQEINDYAQTGLGKLSQDSSSQTHYLSAKLEARGNPAKGSCGVFSITEIQKGELLAAWGGIVVSYQELLRLQPYQQHQAIQVEEGLHLAPYGASEPADCINHSCNPNSHLDGQICLKASRDVAPGEEICFDYATSDSTPYDEFYCACGEANCRGKITATDWKLPELWQQYGEHFSPYLLARIQKMKSDSNK
jgi:hypothetical protein